MEIRRWTDRKNIELIIVLCCTDINFLELTRNLFLTFAGIAGVPVVTIIQMRRLTSTWHVGINYIATKNISTNQRFSYSSLALPPKCVRTVSVFTNDITFILTHYHSFPNAFVLRVNISSLKLYKKTRTRYISGFKTLVCPLSWTSDWIFTVISII